MTGALNFFRLLRGAQQTTQRPGNVPELPQPCGLCMAVAVRPI